MDCVGVNCNLAFITLCLLLKLRASKWNSFYRLPCSLNTIGDQPHTVSEQTHKENLDLLSLDWGPGKNRRGAVNPWDIISRYIVVLTEVKAERSWLSWSTGTLKRHSLLQGVSGSRGICDSMIFGLASGIWGITNLLRALIEQINIFSLVVFSGRKIFISGSLLLQYLQTSWD